MRILLRKSHGVFGALIGQGAGGGTFAAPPLLTLPALGAFGAMLRFLLVPLLLLAAVVLLFLCAPAAASATPAPSPTSPMSPDSVAAMAMLAGTTGVIDAFSTNTLLGVLASLKRPITGLLDRFFTTLVQSQTESVSFEIDESKRYIAPYVHPLSESPVKDMRGQRVETFQPAYVKEKARYTPDRSLRRTIGEAFGGSLTPEQRRDLAVANELQDQMERVIRRKEAQAFEALFTGKLIVEGENYPKKVLNFGRDADLEAAANNLTGGDRWDQANSDPNGNLDDVSETMDKLCGAFVVDVVLDGLAWRAFRKNKQVMRDLELPKYDAGSIQNMEPETSGLQYKGQYGGYRIWKYTNWYTAANGTETKTFDGGYALCIGQIDGVQHQGAIMNEEAGMQPLEIFPDSWVQKDPSVRWIKSESSPLVVPQRINACAVMKVLNAA